MDNQYGQTMTKPLPYGCIKKQEHPPSLTEFNRVLDKISHNDNIRHFIVDIKFNDMNPKTLFNEINPAIFEKKKRMQPYGEEVGGRSCDVNISHTFFIYIMF